MLPTTSERGKYKFNVVKVKKQNKTKLEMKRFRIQLGGFSDGFVDCTRGGWELFLSSEKMNVYRDPSEGLLAAAVAGEGTQWT